MPKPPLVATEPQRAGASRASTRERHNTDAIVGLLFHLLTVTIVIVGVLLAQAAAAEDRTSAMRDACLSDYQRLCSSVTPGGGRIKQCMLDHASDLSNECRSALLAAQGSQ